MNEAIITYPEMPVDLIPVSLRKDITWITPWICKEFPEDPKRVDWARYGRDSSENPVFSQLILYDGENRGWREAGRLVDEEQMAKVILGKLGIRSSLTAS